MKTIYYTKTDEAPALATQSFLPMVQSFARIAGINFVLKDISLAGRILSAFSHRLPPEQRCEDGLAELGKLVLLPQANIIKLPNISASVPQLKTAIKELQSKGFCIPDYPENPQDDEQKAVKKTYSKVLGSAVNPVLREGNSDRRVAVAVKEFAQDHPHSMGAWSKDSRTHVASMSSGDFFGSEKSVINPTEQKVVIEHVGAGGSKKILKEPWLLLENEIIDSAVMSVTALKDFFNEQIQDAKKQELLFSLHLKATMMKVSDPIIFGHGMKVFFERAFDEFGDLFAELGVNRNNGLGDLLSKIETLSEDKKKQVLEVFDRCFEDGPALAMVDSERGISNLHVPSDVIIDASMPAAIRSSGKMWGPDGQLHEMKAVIPDRSYSGIYQEVIDFCKTHGAFDVTSMGSVSNIGLMAKKAEEYGSHDKTFEVTEAGSIRVITEDGDVLLEHAVEIGDIWRMCQTKEVAVRDWVKLGVARAQDTQQLAIFWLNKERAHDRNLIERVEAFLKEHDTAGLDLRILSPVEAMRLTLQEVRSGKNVISITGNVLRDYLTDLFPILELGTSAKMLSIVPLLSGGVLYETGAGGSAPKHVQQFLEENHLRWDSLGEFLALEASLEGLAKRTGDVAITALARALGRANSRYLQEDRSPSRRVGCLDSRGSHFYLSLYWAQALAEQKEVSHLSECFSKMARQLEENTEKILEELNGVQGTSVDVGGYYWPGEKNVSAAMRPSSTFNAIIDSSFSPET